MGRDRRPRRSAAHRARDPRGQARRPRGDVRPQHAPPRRADPRRPGRRGCRAPAQHPPVPRPARVHRRRGRGHAPVRGSRPGRAGGRSRRPRDRARRRVRAAARGRRARHTTGRGARGRRPRPLLHERHDRPAEGRGVLAPVDGPARARAADGRLARDRPRRRRDAGHRPLPRARLGAAVRGRPGRRRSRAPRPQQRAGRPRAPDRRARCHEGRRRPHGLERLLPPARRARAPVAT